MIKQTNAARKLGEILSSERTGVETSGSGKLVQRWTGEGVARRRSSREEEKERAVEGRSGVLKEGQRGGALLVK